MMCLWSSGSVGASFDEESVGEASTSGLEPEELGTGGVSQI
jgi:hypothetical protein